MLLGTAVGSALTEGFARLRVDPLAMLLVVGEAGPFRDCRPGRFGPSLVLIVLVVGLSGFGSCRQRRLVSHRTPVDMFHIH